MNYKNYIIDMDGVLVNGKQIIPGADVFIEKLKEKKIKFLVLTNNPIFTPADLAYRLKNTGLEISEDSIFTSAMATAAFLKSQKSNAKAFVVGDIGLTTALHNEGFVLTDIDPDYVVLGETHNYHYETITKAIRLITRGAHFIATNPDPSGPTEGGISPACGAMAALFEKASGKSPFFVGKPNPYMMRSALRYLGVHSENTVMIGDRMDTDIIAGIETGLETILVLSGSTTLEDIARYPYQPTRVVTSIADLEIESINK